MTHVLPKVEHLRQLHLDAATGDRGAVDVLVDRYRGLARSLAIRYARGHQDSDDLLQVAMFGLLQALKRFDPDRGFEFSTFAYATIEGELKRHRRRTSWTVHVPRRIQESFLHVASAADRLGQELGREPTVAEIAADLGMTPDDVIEVLDIRDAQRPASLDANRLDDDGGVEIPTYDGGFEQVDGNELVENLLRRLSGRERDVVAMRFFDNLTQREIGERLGLSQMHVSRTLRTALEKLRILASSAA